ncbi:PLP-dependent aminotransferase family protein [Vibrio hippocampi]|uniref:Histidinol-phosphate aminotransferase n=1 Tax=Vibrio hippocampi TaxID=654686 RepID=A0ABN8DDT7_9VIBR|nr:PLP-dependent aminotransferase family protein [Vibrio hippocampi]CAH0524566.1 Histidinol-phosphate aminotransferase [Vibrio hippocampi]
MTIEEMELNRHGSVPIYKQIADQIGARIDNGTLLSNSKLPTHRWLADRLEVTVGTITRAYAELERRGHIEARVGAGTFVVDHNKPSWAFEQDPSDELECHLGYNIPPRFDRSDMLQSAMQRIATSPQHLNQIMLYQSPTGIESHKGVVCNWMRAQQIHLNPQSMLFSSGAQHAIQLILDTFSRAGDTILVEQYTYPGIINVAKQNQLTLKGVEMDKYGVLPESLELCCKRYSPRLIYLIPTLQNPTTAVMPIQRRREILDICKRYDVYVIEDDINSLLLDNAPEPMVNLAPESVLYIGAFSKFLAPGLRVGFIHAPERLYPQLTSTLQNHCWMVSPLLTSLTCEMLSKGDADKSLQIIKQEMNARIEIAVQKLKGFEFTVQQGGFHLWLTLPQHWRLSDFIAQATMNKINVKSSELFALPGNAVTPAIRLSLSSPQSIEQMRRGLDTLVTLLNHTPTGEFTL